MIGVQIRQCIWTWEIWAIRFRFFCCSTGGRSGSSFFILYFTSSSRLDIKHCSRPLIRSRGDRRVRREQAHVRKRGTWTKLSASLARPRPQITTGGLHTHDQRSRSFWSLYLGLLTDLWTNILHMRAPLQLTIQSNTQVFELNCFRPKKDPFGISAERFRPSYQRSPGWPSWSWRVQWWGK